jgi:hypothetical protein
MVESGIRVLTRKLRCFVMFFALGLAACQPPTALVTPPLPATVSPSTDLPAEPASNFGFVFEYSVCYLEVFDTFSGTFRREVATEPPIVIPAALSAEQMRMVYAKLTQIDFFSYAARYAVPTPESGAISVVTPAYSYSLMVRNADSEHTVTWEDEIVDPNPPEASRLRELFQSIFGMIKNQPDVAKLPRPRIGCV